jgi:PTH2 family peptidyl-tRNA hydrolase
MLKQYYLINTDLKMGKGKIAVQVAHGIVIYMETVLSTDAWTGMKERYEKWRNTTPTDNTGMMKKVVVKSTQMEIVNYTWKLKREKIWAYPIHDRGLTQIPADSLTCLVIEPIEEEIGNRLFGNLKLL